MNIEQALKILHPDTTKETLADIDYCDRIGACNEALLTACEEIKRLQKENESLNIRVNLYQNARYSCKLFPDKNCAVYHEYKVLGTKEYLLKNFANRTRKKNAELQEKLCEYEQAEDDGLLVRLPCKIGDTVYWMHKRFNVAGIISGTVKTIKISSFGYDLEILNSCGTIKREFEKVFLTRKEAEQALEEAQGK